MMVIPSTMANSDGNWVLPLGANELKRSSNEAVEKKERKNKAE
jgi:hypothetical protein